MSKKVVVLDGISQTGVDILKESLDVDVLTGKSEEEIIAFAGNYAGMVVRSQTTITPAILDAAKNLKVIGRAGVGVDNIDVLRATERGVVVINSPEGNTIAAAEQAVALMFSMARMIPQAHATMQKGGWDRKKFTGIELYGKTLGLVGLGKIGGYVAKCAAGLSMNVIAFDPVVSIERANQLGAKLVSLEDLASQADFISLHTPLNDQTKHMINAEFLGQCKKGVRIVNCARGGVIDDQALLDALKSGQVAGAALDVFAAEPLAEDSPLRGVDNLILTPHLGASTVEAQENVALDVCRQIRAYLAEDEPVATAVNMPALTGEIMEKVAPYLRLGKDLGALFGQLSQMLLPKTPHHSITYCLTHRGPLSQKELDLVGRSLIVGQFGHLHDDLNLVNAPVVMERQGASLNYQTTTDSHVWPASISLKADIGGETLEVGGHVDTDGSVKIHQIGPYAVDLHPEGRFLITRHTDQPGMIGKVGTLLGEKNINVAGMMVGRKKVRGEALMMLQLDDDVPEAVLEELRQLEGMEEAGVLEFP